MSVFDDLMPGVSTIVMTTFGEEVILYLEGREPIAAMGLFNAAYQAIDVSTGVPVSTVHPLLEVVSNDLPAKPEEGDTVSIQGMTYLIVDVRPDGNGYLKLALQRT